MASKGKSAASAMEIDRLATQLAKDPHSKVFLPLAEEYCKVGMWEEAVSVLENGLKYYPGFITAMVALGRAYDHLNQQTKARAVLEGAVRLSPENLRAHRTLIKLYTAQGLADQALRSCNVILSMNPRDEEALSVQASLGIQAQPDPATPQEPVSAQTETLMPEMLLAAESTAAAPIKSPQTVMEEPAAASEPTPVSPIIMASNIMEHALHESDHAQPGEATETVSTRTGSHGTEKFSPHTETIAQLESWLRSIARQRRDRAASGDVSS